MNNEEKISDIKILKGLMVYLKPYKLKYILAILFALTCVVLELSGPLLLSYIVDMLTSDKQSLNRIYLCAGLYLSLSVLLVALFEYLKERLLTHVGSEVASKLREDVFESIIGMSHREFSNIPTGRLITRLTSDTNAVLELFTKTFNIMLRDIFILSASVVIMVAISWQLSLVMLAITPVILIITFLFAKYSKYKYRKVREAQTNLNSFISEGIDGIRVIKAYEGEDMEYDRFVSLNKEYMKNNLTQTFVFAIFRPLIYSIHLICVLLLLYFGGILVLDGKYAPGIIIAFYSYSSYYFDPIQEIAEELNKYHDAISSCEKIFNLLKIKSSIVEKDNPIRLQSIRGKIEFRNVYFRYNENQDYILKDVSFVINPYETIALVGPTGGGKSTIINLIERNYDPEKGEILIDDINIRDLSLTDLRKSIGVMLQEVHLFKGSIAENISMFDDSIKESDIRWASKLVDASSVIEELPEGYNTMVMQKGGNFSQGQRQLISFSRALASHPSVMLLDEATANIDSKTESMIQNSLIEMSGLGTMVIVAHRLSTIKHSTRIMVVCDGKIVESGTHKELLDEKGMYYTLYMSQYKEV